MAAQQINPADELTRVGIGLTWQGPDFSTMNEVGGRAHVALTSRKSNKRVEQLHVSHADDAEMGASIDERVTARLAAKQKRVA